MRYRRREQTAVRMRRMGDAAVETTAVLAHAEEILNVQHVDSRSGRFAYGFAVWMQLVTVRMNGALDRNPRRVYGIAAVLAFLCMVGVPLRAQGQVSFLNPVLDVIGVDGWLQNSLNLGVSLFGILALTTLCTVFVVAMVQFRTVNAALVSVLKSGLALAIPYSLIQGTTAVALFTSGGASSINGVQTSSNGLVDLANAVASKIANSNTTTDVATLMKTFAGLAWSLPVAAWTLLQTVNAFDVKAVVMNIFIVAVVVLTGSLPIFATGLAIAVVLVVSTLRLTFALPLLAWQLGFMGSGATAPIAMGVWNAMLKHVTNFIAAILLAAGALKAGTAMLASWKTAQSNFNTITDPFGTSGLIRTSFSATLACLLLAYLVWKLPEWVSAGVSGAPNMLGIGAIGDSMQAAKGVAGGASQGERATSTAGAAAAGFSRGGVAGAVAGLAMRAGKK